MMRVGIMQSVEGLGRTNRPRTSEQEKILQQPVDLNGNIGSSGWAGFLLPTLQILYLSASIITGANSL